MTDDNGVFSTMYEHFVPENYGIKVALNKQALTFSHIYRVGTRSLSDILVYNEINISINELYTWNSTPINGIYGRAT